jgi:hypothetical protein
VNEPTDPAVPADLVQDGPDPATPRRRRFPLALVAAAVSLGLVAGGGTWGWSALQDADRTAPTVVWAEPAEHPESDIPALEPTGLAADLLPMPPHYRPGPDVDEFGNDSVLDAERAVALFKEGSRGLPSAKRKRHDKAIEKLGIKGLAVRSYRPTDSRFVMETRLAQLENTKAVGRLAAFQKEMADAFGVFRKGPKIKGHPKATCFLMPETDDVELDIMMCTAPVGEVLVSVYAYGAKPLATGTIKNLVREQLDHISSPGEAV